jgi:hypothetical protein
MHPLTGLLFSYDGLGLRLLASGLSLIVVASCAEATIVRTASARVASTLATTPHARVTSP